MLTNPIMLMIYNRYVYQMITLYTLNLCNVIYVNYILIKLENLKNL